LGLQIKFCPKALKSQTIIHQIMIHQIQHTDFLGLRKGQSHGPVIHLHIYDTITVLLQHEKKMQPYMPSFGPRS
jgi:hypothetical protein